MKDLCYRVILEPDDNGTFLVICPDFPEFVTCGDDEKDALKRAVDALETVILFRLVEKKEIPDPSEGRGYRISPCAEVAAKVMLTRIMQEKGASQEDVARASGMPSSNISRLLNPRQKGRITSYEKIFRAFGYAPSYKLEFTQQSDDAANPV